MTEKEAVQTEQSTPKQQRLLTAVRDMILENGIQGASMSKISKAAGLPMGTIYAMFPTKDDLVNATYAFCKERYMGSIPFPQLQRGTDWEAAIEEAILAYIDSAIAHDKDFLFVEQCYLNPIIRPELLSDGRDLLGNVGMDEIINQESPKHRPTYLVQHLVLAALHKFIILCLTDRISLNAETKEEITHTCWNILRN